MGAYIIRRLLLLIPTLFLLTLIVFLLVRLMPGNVVDVIVQEILGLTPNPPKEGVGLAS